MKNGGNIENGWMQDNTKKNIERIECKDRNTPMFGIQEINIKLYAIVQGW